MKVEFAGEGKYESQWDAFDDGYACQAEMVNDMADDARRLRDALEELHDWLEQRVLDIIPEIDRPATQARINMSRAVLDGSRHLMADPKNTFDPDYLCDNPICRDSAIEQLEGRKEDADEIERLKAMLSAAVKAIQFAHSEGFSWPTDPMAVIEAARRVAKPDDV